MSPTRPTPEPGSTRPPAAATTPMSHRRCHSHLDVTSVWLLESASCGEREAEVAAVAFRADAAGPAGDQVAAGADDARPHEGPGTGQAPAGPGDAHTARGRVTAGAPARKEKSRPRPQHRNQGHPDHQ